MENGRLLSLDEGKLMSKFFILPDDIHDNKVFITGDEAHHIIRVLRMKTGDELVLCNSRGIDYKGVIVSNSDEVFENIMSKSSDPSIQIKILDSWNCKTEPPIEVTLFQGLPKGDKMEYIIQKCVELGISRIVPVATEFAIAKLSDKKNEAKKLLRWNKISSEAAKQCGRGCLPKISEVLTLKNAVEQAKDYDLVFVPYEKAEACIENGFRNLLMKFRENVKQNVFGKVLSENKSSKPKVGFFIGPEGGFSKKEMDEFISNAITPISLGKRILRTETASLTVLSILMYEIGDIK